MSETIKELSYEQAVLELENILKKLESRDTPLEETLALFERGTKLGQYCQGILTQTEQKIQGLVDENGIQEN